ncbi:Glycerophosphoryl diester phosphodiesterase [Actinokineospora spheciospongiae]|uniref:glycerophosphodiester phosphodiesterase n=1 Tax=Actinokineospora spheciospongiae TaxID=909613 RepID=W7IQW8_9PSEU|nr:glycerophosphodiester phosphodiesterase [Actinokineospora spheciospongiae]EWC58956.1 Glycerophosphoryl diester phosphodiesterase [Actinokineospora spheciospongiae]PWW61773.1 glycerophosphoryl diester phosphodiesterase [Actinokineospora spheciospongiae]
MTVARMLGVAVSALALVGTAALSSAAAAPEQAAGRPGERATPLVIGHRGASGYRPEHTLAGYELAARMGADFIEPDLVSTKDGVLVARHEPEIGGTTDVAAHPEFAGRRTTKDLDGVAVTGWFTEDFTLAELKTLRATERIPDVRQENTIHNGRHQVPTLQEVIDLKNRLSRELGREVGIYPETKHPTYFQRQGLALEPELVRVLNRNGLNRRNAKVFVQSFEVANLKALHRELRVPLVQLTSASGAPYDFVAAGDERTYADVVSAQGLKEVSTYADGVGPDKNQVVARDAAGNLAQPTRLVADAHAVGLKVHPYTFRAENTFLPKNLRSDAVAANYGDLFAELSAFWKAGVDGVFSDNPDIAVASRAENFPRA